ncbi:hypothetical protein BD309DRAFT_1016864 [Dichomitus squalens]|nr:hypothetical protein BD309DRAFT_1016864 [Dichomitus squalens]
MNFAQVVKPSLERERAQERRVVNVVLPAIRADTCRPSEDQLDFEERGIDAARKSERSSRHRPYRIPSMATGAHRQTQKERRKASENDLPPLRLLINQIEYDEHRRVQMRAQFRFQVPFADKLPIPAAAPMKRSSFTPSRHEDGAGTVASVPVQQPMVSSSLRAPITSVPTSQQLVAGSISLAFFNSRSFVPMHGSPSSSANESRGAGAHAL